MKGVKGNGTSKIIPLRYLEEYRFRERHGRDEPTSFNTILSHITGFTGNNKENQPKPIIVLHFQHRYIFKIIQIEVIIQLADLNMALGLTLSLAVTRLVGRFRPLNCTG